MLAAAQERLQERDIPREDDPEEPEAELHHAGAHLQGVVLH